MSGEISSSPEANGAAARRARRVGSFLRSPALVTATAFAAGGIGFAAGNLLLARILPHSEFGYLALFFSLTQLGMTVGPLGLETVINRHQLAPEAAWLVRAFWTSALVGCVVAIVAFWLYGMAWPLALMLAAAVLGAGLNRVAGSMFQSRQRFVTSLSLLLIHNWIVLAAVPVVLLFDPPHALPAASLAACGYFAVAAVGWRLAWQDRQIPGTRPRSATVWREGLAAVGLQLAVSILFQLDRLIIPHLLSISELATYSVVAVIAGAPFRMLQVGVGYTLLPRLRQCADRTQIRRLIRREAVVMLPASALAAAGVLAVTPWITRHFLDGRYPVSAGLVFAVVGVGLVRVWNGFASVSVTALGSARQLMILNLAGWLAVVLAILCAAAAAHLGLVGIVCGLGAGWLALASTSTVLAGRAIRARPRTSAAHTDGTGLPGVPAGDKR